MIRLSVISILTCVLYANLAQASNTEPPPAARGVMADPCDSITFGWGGQAPGPNPTDTINRGIGGQTTAQMLVRFRSDVVDLRPRLVHLMMGTNDIAGNTGATSLKRIKSAIASMAEQAQAKGIRVLIGSVLPAKVIPWRPEVRPAATIRALNSWIKAYAEREGFIFVDYYSALVDAQGGLAEKWTRDGVHPNSAGYQVMRPLVEEAIQKAVSSHSLE